MSTRCDRQRKEDMEEARRVREVNLAARKRAALRVLAAGGTLDEAARVASADTKTVRRWQAEARGGGT